MSLCAATVGTFDGLHLGHRDLLNRLTDVARQRGLATHVITFENHPLEVIAPARAPKLVSPRQPIFAKLRQMAFDHVSAMSFTPELAHLTAAEFMQLLRSRYDVQVLLMGFNNTIGSDRLASHDDYIRVGQEVGVEVLFADEYVDESTGLVPSSSLLRKLIREGDFATFSKLAASDYYNFGTVARGKQNGRKIGFPTFNIDYDRSLELPAAGVYAGRVDVKGEIVEAVISVGNNPTIGDGNPITMEAHAIGREYPACYGEPIKVVFSQKLRDLQKFGSVDDLRRAIANDISRVSAANKV